MSRRRVSASIVRINKLNNNQLRCVSFVARGSFREDHIKRNCSQKFTKNETLGGGREGEITLSWCHEELYTYCWWHSWLYRHASLGAPLELDAVALGHGGRSRDRGSFTFQFAPESKQICCSANFPRCRWPIGHLSEPRLGRNQEQEAEGREGWEVSVCL